MCNFVIDTNLLIYGVKKTHNIINLYFSFLGPLPKKTPLSLAICHLAAEFHRDGDRNKLNLQKSGSRIHSRPQFMFLEMPNSLDDSLSPSSVNQLSAAATKTHNLIFKNEKKDPVLNQFKSIVTSVALCRYILNKRPLLLYL